VGFLKKSSGFQEPESDYRAMRIFREVEKVFLNIGGAEVSRSRP
jgi:hypothetical protein